MSDRDDLRQLRILIIFFSFLRTQIGPSSCPSKLPDLDLKLLIVPCLILSLSSLHRHWPSG